MSYIDLPITASPSVNTAVEKLNKKRTPPKVNLPALARRDGPLMSCIKPAREGDVFISSDFSSLEPSITAEYSKDEYYTHATCTGIGKRPYFDASGVLMIDDVYLMTASVMPNSKDKIRQVFSDPKNIDLWMIDKNQIKDGILKKERKNAKPACLGFNYGMGPRRFVTQSFDAGNIVTLSEAKAMYKAYWNLYKGIGRLTKLLEKKLEKNGHIVNPFGYRLTTNPHKGYNAFIQSSASGVVDLFCLHFFPNCPEATFVTLVHDEVIYTCAKEYVESCRIKQQASVDWLNDTLKFSVPMRLGFCEAASFKEIK